MYWIETVCYWDLVRELHILLVLRCCSGEGVSHANGHSEALLPVPAETISSPDSEGRWVSQQEAQSRGVHVVSHIHVREAVKRSWEWCQHLGGGFWSFRNSRLLSKESKFVMEKRVVSGKGLRHVPFSQKNLTDINSVPTMRVLLSSVRTQTSSKRERMFKWQRRPHNFQMAETVSRFSSMELEDSWKLAEVWKHTNTLRSKQPEKRSKE